MESQHIYTMATYNAQHKDDLCSYSMDTRLKRIRIPHMLERSQRLNVTFPMQNHYVDLFENKKVNPEMICIMTPSYGKQMNARLNYNHLMAKDGVIQPYIHLVFVRQCEFDDYKKYWENFVGIVEIPEEMDDIEENVNNGGIGYARRYVN